MEEIKGVLDLLVKIGLFLKNKWAREIEKKQSEIINFYEPLFKFTENMRSQFMNFAKKANEKGYFDVPFAGNENAEWKLLIEEQLSPIHHQIEKLIEKEFKLDGNNNIPKELAAFLNHVGEYKVLIKKWKNGDFTHWCTDTPFPKEFQDYVKSSYFIRINELEKLKNKFRIKKIVSDKSPIDESLTINWKKIAYSDKLSFLKKNAEKYLAENDCYMALSCLYKLNNEIQKIKYADIRCKYLIQFQDIYDNAFSRFLQENHRNFRELLKEKRWLCFAAIETIVGPNNKNLDGTPRQGRCLLFEPYATFYKNGESGTIINYNNIGYTLGLDLCLCLYEEAEVLDICISQDKKGNYYIQSCTIEAGKYRMTFNDGNKLWFLPNIEFDPNSSSTE